MLERVLRTWIVSYVLFFITSPGVLLSQQLPERPTVLNSAVDENTAVRFFYEPESEYFHYPLVFRPVEEGDPRLNTAPMREEGRTAYISLAEMSDLIQRLLHAGLGWQESQTVEALGSCTKLTRAGLGLDSMDVFVSGSNGTARTKIPPKAICGALRPLDGALKTPRALWELQRFRLNYGCKVPGFKYHAFPDHY